MTTPLQTYFPLLVVLLVAVGMTAGLIGLASLLGPKRVGSPQKGSPFECGSESVGSAHERFGVKFYVVALLFIVFDVEAIFVYPWAVLFKELGWVGFVEMGVFAFTLLIGLVYVLKKGALEWDH
jgi:NADH-quinone oxidoreductase subunit A